ARFWLIGVLWPLPLAQAQVLHEKIVLQAPADRTVFGPSRPSPTLHPDRDTARADLPDHVEDPFRPSVAPFERVRVFDAAGMQLGEILRIADESRRRIEVVGARKEAGRPTYTGSVWVDLEPGKWSAIPSVAAGARLLSYVAEPKTEVTFARDSADNWFVTAET